MNFLTVFSLAVVAGCSSAQLLNYPGVYGGYAGWMHGSNLGGIISPMMPYAAPGIISAEPITVEAAEPITLKTIAPTPLALPYQMSPYAAASPIMSQFQSQDGVGQYAFGYAGGFTSRAESRDIFGNVRGSFNYIDADGEVQTQHYVADALGYRVTGTNLPVAPEVPEAAPLALPGPMPEPVEDTPEVAEAKAAFKMAYDEAAAAAAAAPDARKKRSVMMAPALGAWSPLRYSYGYSAAMPMMGSYLPYAGATTYTTAAAASGLRDAEVLRVMNNPNHAVSYRVY